MDKLIKLKREVLGLPISKEIKSKLFNDIIDIEIEQLESQFRRSIITFGEFKDSMNTLELQRDILNKF